MKRNNKAITLIALVITIVVLIILAAVAINLSLGNNGIFNRAKTAKEQYQNAQDYEETGIAKVSNKIDDYIGVSGSTRFNVQSTDLWTGNAANGGTITLSESYKNFKELVIYFGNPTGEPISKETVELSTLNWLRANNRSFRMLWYSNEYVQFSIANDTTFNVTGNYVATIAKITGINYQ